jgi:hypothetical protein
MHLQDGINNLNDSWEDLKGTLETGPVGPEYYEALGEVKTLLGSTF